MGIVQENEIYLSDDRLCFLFSLLVNNGATITCANEHVANDFTENFEIFVSEIFETYIQTLPNHKREHIIDELSEYDSERIPYEYNDWYDITYSDKDKQISITLKQNGSLLYDTLSRYADNHWDDDLCTWNETNHYCSEKICKDFYQQILDYNAKTYYVNDTKNIHAILLGHFKGYIEIKRIECEVDLSSIGNMLIQPCYINEYPTNTVTHFKCCINANSFKKEFDKLIRGQVNKTSVPMPTKKITKYPPQQQAMYNCIVKWIENMGTYNLPPEELIHAIGIKYTEKDVLNNAISELNNCYKKLNNTDNKLIKKNRKTGFYEISTDFKI